MIRSQADLEVTGRRGETVALIEVKDVPRLTSASAADIRRGLLEDEPADSPKAYFLVVSQDQAFLWEPRQADNLDADPATVFSMGQVLREYLTDKELGRHLRGAALEIAVRQWLGDLTRGLGLIPSEAALLPQFAERLRGGVVHGGGPRP